MLAEDLMIWDKTGPIAIAGVMGGEESEIKEGTSNLLLESANFHPARIRRTSVRLGLRTDAGLRFEKGQPPYHTGISVRRFVTLLENAGQKPVIKSKMTCAGNTTGKLRRIKMKVDHISRTIGMEIPEKKISGILSSLGFSSVIHDGHLTVEVPPHRSVRDVSIPNDIVEEVSRIYGYDNIEPSMPSIELSRYDFNPDSRKQYKIQRYLSAARGFNEVMTYSWYNDVWLKKIGYEPEKTLTLLNPANENTSRMRREIIPNLFELVETNSVYRDSFSLYEIGQVFLPEDNSSRQPRHLAGLSFTTDRSGTLQDLFLALKGAVEGIMTILGVAKSVFTPSHAHRLPWETPGTVMNIIADGKKVGDIGYVSGKFMENFEKGTLAAWFELNLDEITSTAYPEITYEEIPIYPGSWMDFSILYDKAAGYKSLSDMINEFSRPVLKKAKFLYLYDGKGLPEGKGSYTFRFWLGSKERTLTGDDISGFRSEFLDFLNKNDLKLR
jgi:phenylalanyl-tRNA synthetase beta chain